MSKDSAEGLLREASAVIPKEFCMELFELCRKDDYEGLANWLSAALLAEVEKEQS
jgi:hypothetical protein